MEVRDVLIRGWGPWQSIEWKNLSPGFNFLETTSESSAGELEILLGAGFAQSSILPREYEQSLPTEVRLRVVDGSLKSTIKSNEKGQWNRLLTRKKGDTKGEHVDVDDVRESVELPSDAETVDRFFAPYRRRPAGIWQFEAECVRDLIVSRMARVPRKERPSANEGEPVWSVLRAWLEQGNDAQQDMDRRTQANLRRTESWLKAGDMSSHVNAWQNACKEQQRVQVEIDKLESKQRRLRAFHRLKQWQRRWLQLQAEKPRVDLKQVSAVSAAVPRVQALQKQRDDLSKKHARWQTRRKKFQELAGIASAQAAAHEVSTVEASEASPQELRKLLAHAKSAWSVERRLKRPQRLFPTEGSFDNFSADVTAMPTPAQSARRSELDRELQQAQTILQTLREQRQEALARHASVSQLDRSMEREPIVAPAAWQRERQELQQEFEAMRAESQALRRQCEQTIQPGLMNDWQRVGVTGLFLGGLVAIVFGIFLNLDAPVWPVVGVGCSALVIGVMLRISDERVSAPRMVGQRARLDELQFDMHENRRRWQQLETTPVPIGSQVIRDNDNAFVNSTMGQEVEWLDAELEAANSRVDVLRQQLVQLGPESLLAVPPAAALSHGALDPVSSNRLPSAPVPAAQRKLLQQWKQRAARCLRDTEVLADDCSVRRIMTRLRRENSQVRRQLQSRQRARKQYRSALVQERRWEKELQKCSHRKQSLLRRFRCEDLAALVQLQQEGERATVWRRKSQGLVNRVRRRLPTGITVQTLDSHLQQEERELGELELVPLQERLSELHTKQQQGLLSLAKDLPREGTRNSDIAWNELEQQWSTASEPVASWTARGMQLLTQFPVLSPESEPASKSEAFRQTDTLRLASEWCAQILKKPGLQLGTHDDDARLCVKFEASAIDQSLALLSDEQIKPILFALRCAVVVGLHRQGTRCPMVV
ncbi:MAG: hypothetical protein O2931_06685, partial [Planctomycetota bacterium]|nr:hypothetical protein [Planctomycetota bacterium]